MRSNISINTRLTFVVLSLLFFRINGTAQLVETQYGEIMGHTNGSISEFLGIPFASPPVGELRWRPTTAPDEWNDILIVDNFPPKCPQKSFKVAAQDSSYTLEGEEDCLYLNIWTPNVAGNFPVMVFIHGGGNQQGSTSQISAGTEIYNGKNLSEHGEVVVVTIQYRLGSLGYLVHPGLEGENTLGISGNYGVMDQVFALEWVQKNIKNFGGDQSNITIFGESAGGVNVGNLIISDKAKGLFHKAIIQSAVPVINAYNVARYEGIDFVNSFAVSGSDEEKIEQMRQIHADSLTILNKNPLEGGVAQMVWQPVLDMNILKSFPVNAFESGEFNHVPLIIGSNADEMSLSVPQVVSPAEFTAVVNSTIPAQFRESIFNLYPPGSTTEQAKESLIAFLSDAQFTSTVRRTAQCMSLNQSEPVYRYLFSHTHNPLIPFLGSAKSYHGIELFYVFNTWENSPVAIGPIFTSDDEKVQNLMLDYWTNFAYSGDPNSSLLTQWPIYNPQSDTYIDLKSEPDGTLSALRKEKCDLWDAIVGFQKCIGMVNTKDELLAETSLQIYPNPSSGIFNIKGLEGLEYYLVVYNTFGNVVKTQIDNPEIDLSEENNGVYYVKIKSSNRSFDFKLVKL